MSRTGDLAALKKIELFRVSGEQQEFASFAVQQYFVSHQDQGAALEVFRRFPGNFAIGHINAAQRHAAFLTAMQAKDVPIVINRRGVVTVEYVGFFPDVREFACGLVPLPQAGTHIISGSEKQPAFFTWHWCGGIDGGVDLCAEKLICQHLAVACLSQKHATPGEEGTHPLLSWEKHG